MPGSSPQSRFGLRASALIIVFLLIWWTFLRNPMAAMLRVAVETIGVAVYGDESGTLITETPAGDWRLRVPLTATIPDSPEHPGGALIHSVDLDVSRTDITGFTFSLTVYWALILAAPGLRHSGRAFIFGSLLIALIDLLLTIAFIELAAHNLAAQLSPGEDAFWKWLRRCGDYLVTNVIPYAAPFVVALVLHIEFRRQIFGWGTQTLSGDTK